jgi:ribose 5-phosphate isomerase A
MTQAEMKDKAARAAADLVKPGMRLGLGTGSTVEFLLDELGRRHVGDLSCVPTSKRTATRASELGIKLLEPFEDFENLDLAIDGADEVSPEGHLIKGAGGAHLWEKLVALAAHQFVVIVDETKMVQRLGSLCPVPVEVIPFGWRQAFRAVREMLGAAPVRRMAGADQPYRTDSGNYLIDCRFKSIDVPASLSAALKSLPGVVDSGLFINLADRVLVGKRDGTVDTLRFEHASIPQRS